MQRVKEDNNLVILCILAVFTTVMSRVNINGLDTLMTILAYFMWGVLFIFTIYHSKIIRITKFGKFYMYMVFAFVIFCFITLAFYKNRAIPGMLRAFLFSFFMYQIGTMVGACDLDIKKMKYVLFAYCFATLILAVVLRFSIFANIQEWMNSSEYLYNDKNYVGQLFGISIIILYFFFKNTSIKWTIIKYATILVIGYVCLLVQCRSAMIAVVCVFGCVLFAQKDHRIQYIGIVVLVIGILLVTTNLGDLIQKSFFIDKYKDTNIDTFTSGRFSWYATAFMKWKRNIFVGIGTFYVDDLYINVLTECGIIGFIIVIPVCIIRFLKNTLLNTYKMTEEIDCYLLFRVLRLITIFYFIESLAEGYPPFGPGVAAFCFWFMSGYVDSKYERA